MTRPPSEHPLIDEIDWALLHALREDARRSMTTLAEIVGISRAGAHARVKKLSELGVIRGYTVKVDPVLTGHHTSAIVTLRTHQSEWQELRAQLNDVEGVELIALVGGEYDVLLLVRAQDNKHLQQLVLEQIQSIPAVQQTRTTLIFEDFERGSLPVQHSDRRAAQN